jgi:hypothetical protein
MLRSLPAAVRTSAGLTTRCGRALSRAGCRRAFYSERLRGVLDAVDLFFGDAGMGHRTLWPRAFGLRTSAPLWTAVSFDRCLLLALIYPIGAVLFMWLLAGHEGPAEHALGLPPNARGLERCAIALITALYCGWRWARGPTFRLRVAWSIATMATTMAALGVGYILGGGGAVSAISNFLGTIAIALAGAIAVAGAGSGAVAGAIVSSVALIPFLISLDDLSKAAIIVASHLGSSVIAGLSLILALILAAFALTLAAGVAGAMVAASLGKVAAKRNCQGPFQIVFLLSMMFVCFLSREALSSFQFWMPIRPFILFLGLLTLVNAPFDWISLGLTRALLRRGLELGAWWPYALALVDAVCAAGIITTLTVVSVFAVQLFEDLAAAGHHPRALFLGRVDGFNQHHRAGKADEG